MEPEDEKLSFLASRNGYCGKHGDKCRASRKFRFVKYKFTVMPLLFEHREPAARKNTII